MVASLAVFIGVKRKPLTGRYKNQTAGAYSRAFPSFLRKVLLRRLVCSHHLTRRRFYLPGGQGFPTAQRAMMVKDGTWIAPMNEAAKIVDQIQRALPRVRRGTLRFWGNWFGRPHDNMHSMLGCQAQQDVLRMHFNEDEVLTVWFPKGFTLDESTFKISDAERVRWEWFAYGRPKTDANRFFEDFIKTGETVVASTNVNWYTPDMKTDLSLPAVEIL